MLVASGHIKNALAGATLEMMMMAEVGPFIAWRFAWQFDGLEPTLIDEVVDGAIDGGLAEAGALFLRFSQDLSDIEGSADLFEGIADDLALVGFALHGWKIAKS